MAALFDEFPSLADDRIRIRKMTEDDVDALMAITDSDAVYRYIPPFLHKKSRATLLTAIRNLGGRDFDKKKLIIAGVYDQQAGDRLVGLAEMFDYHARKNCITIGYRFAEASWGQGLATRAVRLMTDYLARDLGVGALMAYVMPENAASARVLEKNGFRRLPETEQAQNWGGQAVVALNVYRYPGDADA